MKTDLIREKIKKNEKEKNRNKVHKINIEK